MEASGPLDILKEAILLEKRGNAFYQQVADVTTVPAVKAFFQTMADEESHHVAILTRQLKAYATHHAFEPMSVDPSVSQVVADQVLNRDIETKISAAAFEAAAISAAMAMEEKAVRVYSERAAATNDPRENEVYTWLADWERQHLNALRQLDQSLKESIWNDNRFWAF